MAFGAGDIGIGVFADTMDFHTNMNFVEKTLFRMRSRFFSLGASVERLLGPLNRFKQESIATFTSFQSTFAGVVKTVDAAPPVLARLEQSFRNMSLEIPATVEEINNVAASAGQLGIEVENLESFTRTMIDLGETTNLTSEEAAVQLARLANITQMPQTEFSKLGSTVVDLGNNFATTEKEIVSMALRLAAAGNVVGLSETQILAFSAAASSVGVTSELGGTAMSRVFMRLDELARKGGKEFDVLADVIERSGAEFADIFKRDAGEAMTLFIEGLDKMVKSGQDTSVVFDALKLRGQGVKQVLLSAAGAGGMMREAMELANQAWQEDEALTNEAIVRYKTFSSQQKMMRNQIRLIAAEVGEVLVPFLQKWNMQMMNLIQTWQLLNTQQKEFVIKLGGALTLLGPALLMLGRLTNIVFNLSRGLKLFSIVATKAFGALRLIGLGAAVPFAPWIIGIGGLIAGIYALVKVVTSPGGWRGAWESAKGDFTSFMAMAKGFLFNWRENWSILTTWIKDNWKNLFIDMGQILLASARSFPMLFWIGLKTMVRLQTTFNGWLMGTMKRLWEAVFTKEFVDAIVDSTGKAFDAFKEFMTATTEAFGRFIMRLGDALAKAAPHMRQLILALATGNVFEIRDAMVGIGTAMGEEFSSEILAIEGQFKAAGDQLRSDFQAGMEATNPMDPLLGVIREGADEAKKEIDKQFGGIEFRTQAGPQFNFLMPGAKEVKEAPKAVEEGLGKAVDKAKELGAEIKKALAPFRKVDDLITWGEALHNQVIGNMRDVAEGTQEIARPTREQRTQQKLVDRMLDLGKKEFGFMAEAPKIAAALPEGAGRNFFAGKGRILPDFASGLGMVEKGIAEGSEVPERLAELLERIEANTRPEQNTVTLKPLDLPN